MRCASHVSVLSVLVLVALAVGGAEVGEDPGDESDGRPSSPEPFSDPSLDSQVPSEIVASSSSDTPFRYFVPESSSLGSEGLNSGSEQMWLRVQAETRNSMPITVSLYRPWQETLSDLDMYRIACQAEGIFHHYGFVVKIGLLQHPGHTMYICYEMQHSVVTARDFLNSCTDDLTYLIYGQDQRRPLRPGTDLGNVRFVGTILFKTELPTRMRILLHRQPSTYHASTFHRFIADLDGDG